MNKKREDCIKLLEGIIEDVRDNMTTTKILYHLHQVALGISVGLDFSERGNGSYEDYIEYGWYK